MNNLPRLYLARLELKDSKGKTLSVNDYWMTDGNSDSYQEMNTLQVVQVNVTSNKVKGKNIIEVSNPSKEIAAALKLNAVDRVTNEILLPAYFSDGYINLLPGEKRKIEMTVPSGMENRFIVVAEGYNAKSK